MMGRSGTGHGFLMRSDRERGRFPRGERGRPLRKTALRAANPSPRGQTISRAGAPQPATPGARPLPSGASLLGRTTRATIRSPVVWQTRGGQLKGTQVVCLPDTPQELRAPTASLVSGFPDPGAAPNSNRRAR